MADTFIKLFPYYLGEVVSPVVFTFTLVLLGGGKFAKRRTGYFFIGAGLVASAVTIAGYLFGYAPTENFEQSWKMAAIYILLGLIFAGLAAKELIAPRTKTRKINNIDKPKAWQWIMIGLTMNIFNINAVILGFAVAKIVGQSHDLPVARQLAFLFFDVVVFTLVISAPLLFSWLAPQFAVKLFSRLNYFVKKYSRYVVFVLFAAIGIFMITKGINILAG